MMYQFFFMPAVLGIALLMTASTAHAQRGRGGHGGGYYGGGYRPVVIGVGVYPSVYAYPYAYGPYAYGPYVTPRIAYYPPPATVIVQSQPPDAAVPQVQAAPAVAANVAGIRVLVPDPQAKVWFDGTLTSQGGADRQFHTPSLAPGTYTYRIRAAWIQSGKEMVQEQAVTVSLGQTTVVDFTRPISEPVAPPKE